MNDTILPHDKQIEESLLGSALIDPDCILEIEEIIQPEDFNDYFIRASWEVITEFKKAGKPLDPLIVANELASRGITDQSQALFYFTGIIGHTISSLNATAYARIVKDLSDKRKILNLASTIANETTKPTNDASHLLVRVRQIMEKAFDNNKSIKGNRIQVNAKELCMQPTSETVWLLRNLFVAGGINLLVGEPSSGKTFLTLDLSLGITTNGKAWGSKQSIIGNVIYFCQDSSPNVIHRRLSALCKGRGIDPPANLLFDFSPLDLTKHESFSFLKREIKRLNAHLLVFDVFARYTPGVDENAVSAIGPILTGFRELVNLTNCSILAVHHVNKGGNGIAGNMGNRIRGSSDIYGSADAALIVTASGPKSSVERKINPEKNREGIEEHPMIFSILSDKDSGIILDFSEYDTTKSTRVPASKQYSALEIIYEYLRQNSGSRYLRSILEVILQEKGGPISKRTMDRVFSELRKNDSITINRKGKQYEYSFEKS